jgi:thiamine pyrophosphokinase
VDEHSRENQPAVVIAGGDPIERSVVAGLPIHAWTIAADSGLEHAQRLGLHVDLVIGDMDSVSPDSLERARKAGATVTTHPVDKDATDLELAIGAALDGGARHVIIVGGRGGRIDHLLGNALLLADPRLAGISVEWRLADTVVSPARPGHPVDLHGAKGDLVSIVPVGGPAVAVTTTGLRWALIADDLPSGSTRGISNEMVSTEAAVRLGDGVALVIHKRST